MGKRVLIFGVNGFVGTFLVHELVSAGYKVIGSDLHEKCIISEVSAYYPCDLSDARGVLSLVSESNADYIVNLAAISSVGQSWRAPALTMRINVEGALNIMEAARAQETSVRVLLVGL